MAIPRRLIVLAVSAAAAGAVLYVSTKMKKQQQDRKDKSPLDEANDEKKKAEEEEQKKKAAEESSSSSSSSTAEKKEEKKEESSASASSSSSSSSTAQKELALFLAGDAWHDEIGWQALWEKEGVAGPEEWLKTKGKEVLLAERKKLTDHPALLAGCRRRWIVVCRYAGIDVGDAASLWTSTEVAV